MAEAQELLQIQVVLLIIPVATSASGLRVREKLEVSGTVKATAFVGDGSGLTGITGSGGSGFGGIYSRTSSDACAQTNPITGACSCPTGFTATDFAVGISGIEQYLTFCWK